MRLLLVLLISLFSMSSQAANIINKESSPLYTQASTDAPISIQVLPAGTKLQVKKASKGFSLVQTPDGQLGWIKTNLLENIEIPAPTPTPETSSATVSNNANNVRTRLAPIQPLTEQDKLINTISSALNQENLELPDGTFPSTPQMNRLNLLSKENVHLRKELEKAKDYIVFNLPDKNSQGSIAENERLRIDLSILQTENKRLRESNEDQSWFNKTLTFLFGGIFGAVAGFFITKRKKKEDW